MSSEDIPYKPADSCRIPPPKDLEETCDCWFAGIDGLDKLSLLSLFFLLIAGTFIIFTYDPGAEVNAARVSKEVALQQLVVSPELKNKLQIAKKLLAAGNLQKGSQLLAGLIRDYPYNGLPYMLMGDIYMRKQQPMLAMYSYRQGVDLNPDFLDKNTDVFQGKKVKNNLAEVKALVEEGLAARPDDKDLLLHRKTVYYMQRKVAGSCG